MCDYLKQRGVTADGLLKVHLIELCKAVEWLNLPIDPDFLREQLEILPNVARKLHQLTGMFS